MVKYKSPIVVRIAVEDDGWRWVEVRVGRLLNCTVDRTMPGIPTSKWCLSVGFQVFGRWDFDFDFMIAADVNRMHFAPNGDMHFGSKKKCDQTPCVPAVDEIPF